MTWGLAARRTSLTTTRASDADGPGSRCATASATARLDKHPVGPLQDRGRVAPTSVDLGPRPSVLNAARQPKLGVIGAVQAHTLDQFAMAPVGLLALSSFSYTSPVFDRVDHYCVDAGIVGVIARRSESRPRFLQQSLGHLEVVLERSRGVRAGRLRPAGKMSY